MVMCNEIVTLQSDPYCIQFDSKVDRLSRNPLGSLYMYLCSTFRKNDRAKKMGMKVL